MYIIFGVFLTVTISSVHVVQHEYVLVHVHNLMCMGVRVVHCVVVLYFYPADFNVIISPVISAPSKTHPPSNNTPLSIRGTESLTQSSLQGHLNQ